MDELYDLKKDPYEMNNLIDNLNFTDVLVDLKSRLENWRQKTHDIVTKRDLRKDRINNLKGKLGQPTLTNILGL